MAPLLAMLIPAIPALIRAAEKVITAPKSGLDRKDVVRQQLRAAGEKLLAQQAATGTVVDSELDGAIEAVFQQLKSANQLSDPPANVGTVYLVQVGSGGFIRTLV